MIKLVKGDCLKEIKKLGENSVDAIITDPPGANDFAGKDWHSPEKETRKVWVPWFTRVMKQCHKVLKPGGHALIWTVPRLYHWSAWAIEDAGFEIRDIITHLYGYGMPQSYKFGDGIDKELGAERKILGYIDPRKAGAELHSEKDNSRRMHAVSEPATEDAKKWEGWGTSLKPASDYWVLCRKTPSEGNLAQNILKWGVGGINIEQSKINDRWPTNVLLSHHPDCIEDDDDENGECHPDCPVDALKGVNENTLKFFYCGRASRTEKKGNDHPTVKPVSLMKYLIGMIAPDDSTILDPFMGSGTTGVASIERGLSFIGIERRAHYMGICIDRIKSSSEEYERDDWEDFVKTDIIKSGGDITDIKTGIVAHICNANERKAGNKIFEKWPSAYKAYKKVGRPLGTVNGQPEGKQFIVNMIAKDGSEIIQDSLEDCLNQIKVMADSWPNGKPDLHILLQDSDEVIESLSYSLSGYSVHIY